MVPGSTNGDQETVSAEKALNHVGRIVGDVGTHRFSFSVEDPDLSATTYIAIEHADEEYLAQVTQIEREVNAKSGDEGALVAGAKIIGRRDAQGRLTVPNTPPKPQTSVEKAGPALVREVLNLDDAGAYLGRLRGLELPVHLDVNELVQKHCSILAKTGAGKSYALGVLMEELLKHEVPVVVIDPHGEHASLQAPNASEHEVPMMRRFDVNPRGYPDQVAEYAVDTDAVPDAEPFRLDERDLAARDIGELLSDGLTSAQTGTLHQAIRDLESPYTLDDIIESVEAQKGSSKWPVLQALEDLQELGILSQDPTPAEHLVQDAHATILNLKGLAPHVQQLVTARVADELFEARKISRVPPHLLVLEEAHNFAPERHLSAAASGEILRTIASEGRKFGMGLSVVSQRPAKVDKNVLSQCNTQIILKVTNANDLKAISKSVEGLPPGIEDEIQALPVGTGLVSEPSIAVPLFCDIRPRETRHGGSSIDVVRNREPQEPTPPPDTTNRSPDTPHDASQTPEPSPEPGSKQTRFETLETIEERIGTASLENTPPGTLERLLVETEQLLDALDTMANEDDPDHARIAGLKSSLRAHHHRIQARLDAQLP